MLIPNVILASASVKLVFFKGLTESSILQYHRKEQSHYAKFLESCGPTKSSKE
jgi:hypothetical protein